MEKKLTQIRNKLQADHSLFECQICGNENTSQKCSVAENREKRETTDPIICQQAIKYTENCRNIHLKNICLAYSKQYCWTCVQHWSNCQCQ